MDSARRGGHRWHRWLAPIVLLIALFLPASPKADTVDPVTSALRFERGLFSKAVGIPAVVNGRLFLPFEDPRLNMSIGEYAVTDGRDWRWRRLPDRSSGDLEGSASGAEP